MIERLSTQQHNDNLRRRRNDGFAILISLIISMTIYLTIGSLILFLRNQEGTSFNIYSHAFTYFVNILLVIVYLFWYTIFTQILGGKTAHTLRNSANMSCI